MAARRTTAIRCALIAVMASLIAIGGASGATAETKVPDGRFALGDSVMLGAKYSLKARGFAVDAQQSRQAYSGPAELRRRGGSLPQNVVVHLGTNGTFPLSTCRSMVKAIGPKRHLYLVTVHVPRSWTKGNNKVIRKCAAENPTQVTVIDWDWAASRHSSWLYSDKTHLTPAGSKAYARVIDQAIARVDAVPAATP